MRWASTPWRSRPDSGRSAMRTGGWVVMVVLQFSILAGCGGQMGRLANEQPTTLLGRLRTGLPLLDCRAPCLDEWRRVQPGAAERDARANWQDLAVLVLRTGYQDDLSLYYLGRAAQGLGYLRAAASYYWQSVQLSGTSSSCEHLSRMCGGVVLPPMASSRLAAIERDLHMSRHRRTRPMPRRPATPTSTTTETESPAPSDSEASQQSPAGKPAQAKDYIEPPPAVR